MAGAGKRVGMEVESVLHGRLYVCLVVSVRNQRLQTTVPPAPSTTTVTPPALARYPQLMHLKTQKSKNQTSFSCDSRGGEALLLRHCRAETERIGDVIVPG